MSSNFVSFISKFAFKLAKLLAIRQTIKDKNNKQIIQENTMLYGNNIKKLVNEYRHTQKMITTFKNSPDSSNTPLIRIYEQDLVDITRRINLIKDEILKLDNVQKRVEARCANQIQYARNKLAKLIEEQPNDSSVLTVLFRLTRELQNKDVYNELLIIIHNTCKNQNGEYLLPDGSTFKM